MTKPKRVPMQLAELRSEVDSPAPAEAKPQPAGAESTTTIYARVPWSVSEKLKDIVQARSRTQKRRVTVQELVAELVDREWQSIKQSS